MTTFRTLYEFEGDPGSEELSFGPGEILTVTKQDVGEGWWEGVKSDGTVGLFPETYVEAVNESSDIPIGNVSEQQNYSDPFGDIPSNDPFNNIPSNDPFGDIPPADSETDPIDLFGLGISIPSNSAEPAGNLPKDPTSADVSEDWSQTANNADDSTENWSGDDWGDVAQPAQYNQPANVAPAQTAQPAAVKTSPSLPAANNAETSSPIKRGDRKATVKLGMNLFSSFTKSPAESFVLGESKANLKGVHLNQINIGEDGPMWESNPEGFSCSISDPVKESKFSGLKSFIAYNITPSHTNVSVQRRFKHFDWLYEQLVRKFGVAISVPQLPDKQITGRYEDDFIEGRRVQLQTWINRIALHPIISKSEVFQHFLTSKDDERAWKAGKRKAEKDEAVGGAFFLTVQTPPQKLDLNSSEEILETNAKFTRAMDDACKQLILLGQESAKKYSTSYKKDCQRFSTNLNALSEAFELDNRPVSAPLTNALQHTSKIYDEVGNMWGKQALNDWNPLLEGLNEYKHVLNTFPAILTHEKGALEKNKEVRRLQLENKVTLQDLDDVTDRTNKIAYSIEAEVNHFQHYRNGDFFGYMKNFLNQQVEFHQNMVSKLQEAAAQYEG